MFFDNKAIKYVIVTGIPRSGTTLAAALLDSCDKTVCLSEPDSHVELMLKGKNAREFAGLLQKEFQYTCEMMCADGCVEDRRGTSGKAVTNYFSPESFEKNRASVSVKTQRIINHDINVFAVKHNALYTSALKEIIDLKVFHVISIIRNPIHVIMSWKSLNLPVSYGRLPAAEKYWPEIVVKEDMNIFMRYCDILEKFYQRYRLLQPYINIIKYEDIIIQPQLVCEQLGIKLPFPEACPQINKNPPFKEETLVISNQIKACLSTKSMPNLTYFYPELGV